MLNLIQFLNGAVGRLVRVALGLVLVWYGLVVLGGSAGAIVMLLGLVPVGLGVWGRCLLEAVPPSNARTV